MSTLKRREREVDPIIEDVAHDSINLEVDIAKKDDCTDFIGIAAGYDMGWQKRMRMCSL